MKNITTYHNFNARPEKEIAGYTAVQGWEEILKALKQSCSKGILVVEFYHGVYREEIIEQLGKLGGVMVDAEEYAMTEVEYHHLVDSYLTEDRIFGIMNTLRAEDLYPAERILKAKQDIALAGEFVVLYGHGASLITHGDLLVYFDMPRWEIQRRFRRGMSNWHTDNCDADPLTKFKQGYFLEWRIADRLKRTLLGELDYIVDTVIPMEPKMTTGDAFREGLKKFATQPFRLVPYYAPEVWGGQWMKEVCELDPEKENYAWAFDGVPEENSILMRFGDVCMEFPSVNVIFYYPHLLLGEKVHARFGDEFPIRFDFLDTMEGQNLSLQVHPLTEYIQHTFGMHYTQDESYYIMDCEEDAKVYLGLKDNVNSREMLEALYEAQTSGSFDAEKYVNVFPAKKHDHFLIPAGTIHCSGNNAVVLEISATPYIFTFKLWDWGRLGLDDKPRAVHLEHGSKSIQWDRTTDWVKANLINCFTSVTEEPDYTETRTGLHEREFIDTRCHTLSAPHTFFNENSVSMCNVVEGEGACISSPENAFLPYEVHYAETFILPASLGEFTIIPIGKTCRILRATVRG